MHLETGVACSPSRHDCVRVCQAVLRLLFNLSFEPSNRDIMVQNGLLRKLVSLLKLPPFRAVTIRLLYHIRCARCVWCAHTCSVLTACVLSRDAAWMTAPRASSPTPRQSRL